MLADVHEWVSFSLINYANTPRKLNQTHSNKRLTKTQTNKNKIKHRKA
jgi:hypothetical protein